MKMQKILLSVLFLMLGVFSYAQGVLTVSGQIAPVTLPISFNLNYESGVNTLSTSITTDSTGSFFIDTIAVQSNQGFVEIIFTNCYGTLIRDSGFYTQNGPNSLLYNFGVIDYCPSVSNQTEVLGTFLNAQNAVNYSLSLDLGVTYTSFTTNSFGDFNETFNNLTGLPVVFLRFTDCNGNAVLDSAFNSSNIPNQEVFEFINLDFCSNVIIPCMASFTLEQNVILDSLNNVISTGNVMIIDSSYGSNLNYTWNFGDGSPLYADTNFTHFYSNNGPYLFCLTVYDGLGCLDTFCDSIMVNANGVLTGKTNAGFTVQMGNGDNVSNGPTAINTIGKQTEMNLFPNPASENITVSFEAENTENMNLYIYSITGKLVQENNISAQSGLNKQIIPLEKLERGVYIIKLKSSGGFVTKTLYIK